MNHKRKQSEMTKVNPLQKNVTSNGNQRRHLDARRKLPVYKFRSEICKLVKENDAVLVVAETGSGKSTQIPAFIHESACLKRKPQSMQINSKHRRLAQTVCVTQPRRVAAITIANRVAEELGCQTGTLVGYRVRFDDNTDLQGKNTTRVIYATDGMLLREATMDPLLTRYSAIALDEAHERSLQTDILFGVVKRAMGARNASMIKSSSGRDSNKDDGKDKDALIRNLLKKRTKELNLPPLHVIVMSATLDVETFQTFFPQAKNIKIPGRQFPVQTLYTKEAQEDYIDASLSAALQIHRYEDEGDVLIFLPGQEEIEALASLLKKHLDDESQLSKSLSGHNQSKNGDENIVQSIKGLGADLNSGSSQGTLVNGVLVCVLYAALPPESQMFAFQPKPKGCTRKIILSTNIAETSVTLDGIKFVIDTGKYKTRTYSSATGMESLIVDDVSKAQASQRSGRAGRVSAGICFRLYPEDSFDNLDETALPEISRVNLSQVVLQLKGMGVHDPRSFDFLTRPSDVSILKAFEQLYALQAIDDKMNLTAYGKKMAKLPLDPTFAHLLLLSPNYNCTAERMLTAISMMSADNVFYRPGGNDAEDSGGAASKAIVAHRRFASYEGDLPTMINVYNCWKKEAIYVSSTGGGKKAKKRMRREIEASKKSGNASKLLHSEWCARNFISGRALVRATDIRNQLTQICSRKADMNGLGIDTAQSCGEEDMVDFLKCACAGLFLQAASRVTNAVEINKAIRKDMSSGAETSSLRGRYKTKIGGREVSIHPTSAIFGRNPPPKCIVYTELQVTKRAYIRGVTQVKEEWLGEVAPDFFK